MQERLRFPAFLRLERAARIPVPGHWGYRPTFWVELGQYSGLKVHVKTGPPCRQGYLNGIDKKITLDHSDDVPLQQIVHHRRRA